VANSSQDSVEVQRTFRAAPADVLGAWTEPARLRQWFQPLGGVAPERVELEARAGGAFRAEFAPPGGARVALEGRFTELRPGRIGLELARREGAGPPGLSTRVTVELAAEGDGTHLVLRHEGVPPDERGRVAAGWRHSLGRMPGALAAPLDRFYGRLERYPRYRSRFGGFWPDLSDAEARIAGKQALGVLTAADAALFRHWVEKGFVVLPGAVAPALADRLRTEMEEAWATSDPRVTVEVFEGGQRSFPRMAPRFREQSHKVLDYHALSPVARECQFAPAVRRFLGQLFERPLLAFQSLYFRWGTEQEMHQDTAYVVLRSPMELVGCWMALEDIQEGSGELQYYVGSHRIPEYLWFGRARARPYDFEDDRDFFRHVHEESRRLGCELQRFRPKKGDVLLWHADLVHGGSKREHPGVTRQSLVSHLCPVDVDPEWLGEVPSSPKLEHASGCFYCHPLR
jgi:uncharacterized protein YndB with AHSA1/START domain